MAEGANGFACSNGKPLYDVKTEVKGISETNNHFFMWNRHLYTGSAPIYFCLYPLVYIIFK